MGRNDNARHSNVSIETIAKINRDMMDLKRFLPKDLQPVDPVNDDLWSIKLHHQATEIAYDINKKNIQMDIVDNNIKNFQVLDNSLSAMPIQSSDNDVLKQHIIDVLNDKI